MRIAKLVDNAYVVADSKDLFPATSFPDGVVPQSFLSDAGCFVVAENAFDPATQTRSNIAPVLIDGVVHDTEVVPKPVAERRAEASAKVTAERRRLEAGGITVLGNQFQTDIAARIRYLRLENKGTAAIGKGGSADAPIKVKGKGLLWPTANGGAVVMTAALAQAVVGDLEGFDVALFEREAVLLATIAASDSPEDVDILAGWPA